MTACGVSAPTLASASPLVSRWACGTPASDRRSSRSLRRPASTSTLSLSGVNATLQLASCSCTSSSCSACSGDGKSALCGGCARTPPASATTASSANAEAAAMRARFGRAFHRPSSARSCGIRSACSARTAPPARRAALRPLQPRARRRRGRVRRSPPAAIRAWRRTHLRRPAPARASNRVRRGRRQTARLPVGARAGAGATSGIKGSTLIGGPTRWFFRRVAFPCRKATHSDSYARDAFITAIISVRMSTLVPRSRCVPENRTSASPSSSSTMRKSGISRAYSAFGPAASAAATLRAATSSAARCASIPLAAESRRSRLTWSPI